MKKSFTLIELLVVIAIIGILSAVVIVSLSKAKLKAKDVKVQTDLAQIRPIMESWANDHGNYNLFTGYPNMAYCQNYVEPDTLIGTAPNLYYPHCSISSNDTPPLGWAGTESDKQKISKLAGDIAITINQIGGAGPPPVFFGLRLNSNNNGAIFIARIPSLTTASTPAANAPSFCYDTHGNFKTYLQPADFPPATNPSKLAASWNSCTVAASTCACQ